jgi:hypothetical protein
MDLKVGRKSLFDWTVMLEFMCKELRDFAKSSKIIKLQIISTEPPSITERKTSWRQTHRNVKTISDNTVHSTFSYFFKPFVFYGKWLQLIFWFLYIELNLSCIVYGFGFRFIYFFLLFSFNFHLKFKCERSFMLFLQQLNLSLCTYM